MPIIKGERAATTPEELMRSRYCAYAIGEIDWVVASNHPETVESVDRNHVERWANSSNWLGLEILDSKIDDEDVTKGEVEFVARYKMDGVTRRHHERSLFQKEDDRWYFHSAMDAQPEVELVPVTAAATVGRNDPCPCGSGKKYKRCCG